jgi:hypothetical protein
VDLSTTVLFALVAMLGFNQLLMRIPALESRSLLFWPLQVLNLVLGVGVLVMGLPGFEHAPAINWIVGLLFIMHVAQNLRIRSDREHRSRRAEIDAMKREEHQRRRDRDRAEAATDASSGDDAPS